MAGMKIVIVSDGRPKIDVTDMTREKAINTLKRLKTTHMGDFGWDLAGAEAFDFAISDMERVEQLEAENKRLKEGVEKVKAAATETLIKFHEDCIQVACKNLLESHVEEVGRIFAAVLIGKPYDQVTRDEVDAMLTAPEEDEDEEI